MKEIFYSKYDKKTGDTKREVYNMNTKTGFILQDSFASKMECMSRSQIRLFGFLILDHDIIKTRVIVVNKNMHTRYSRYLDKSGIDISVHPNNVNNDILALYKIGVIYRVERGLYKFAKDYVVPANIYERAEDVKFELELPYINHIKNTENAAKEKLIIISN